MAAVALCLLCGAVTASAAVPLAAAAHDGRRAAGTVTDASGGGRWPLQLRVAFTAADGHPNTAQVFGSGHAVGDPVQVLYAAGSPAWAYIDGDWTPLAVAIAFGLLTVLFGIGVVSPKRVLGTR